jgi:osmotically-inducible protein OsmY
MNTVEIEAYGRLQHSSKPELHLVQCTFQLGILTLSGTVSDSQTRQAAQDLIADLKGVLIIDNQLTIIDPAPNSV